MDKDTFNDSLGKKMKAERALFQPWGTTPKIIAVSVIALIVLAVITLL